MSCFCEILKLRQSWTRINPSAVQDRVRREEEVQPHQSLIQTPNHIFIIFSSEPNRIPRPFNIIFLSVRSLKINTFFKNMATLGHKTRLEYSFPRILRCWNLQIHENNVNHYLGSKLNLFCLQKG